MKFLLAALIFLSGCSIHSMNSRVADPVDGGPPAIGMGLEKNVIDGVVKQHAKQFHHCYRDELEKDPKFQTKTVARWVVLENGRVGEAAIESATVKNARLESCMLTLIRGMVFPEPVGGGTVEVTYPFHFAPSK